MSAKTLSEDIKRFIVKSLAVYESPSDVVKAVKEKFNRTVTRQGVQTYDPTKVAGEDLSEDLKTLFVETRKTFEENELLPLSRKNDRIRRLSRYVENAENLGNDMAAAGYLEQIAKEDGGMFTNRKEISGPGGGPVAIHSKSLDDWNADAAKRTAEATAVMEVFNEE